MADRKKFEEMLERLINEDKAGAEELFHEIVVEKSREIYEALLEDDLEDKEVDEASDEEVDESDDDEVDEASDEEVDESDDEQVDEDFNLDEFEVEADPMAAMGGDPADDMMGDVEVDGGDMGMDDMGGDEEGGAIEDRVVDLEDALDELKAEFEKMMSGEEGEEGADDMDMGDEEGEESDDEEGEESDDEEEKESYAFEAKKDKKDDKKDDKKKDMKKSAAEEMREYVEKVGGQTYNQFGKMGDNGANTKSAVANKNDMGGTASNLNQAGTEQGVEANKGQLKGNGVFKGGSPKEDNAGNVNVPGSKSATKMSGVAKGHGAEKKGSGDTAANKKSIIGSK
jgi:hypothetical protein